jgi:hypothetical protein
MISLEDCIAMCGLTEAEVAAIAEHEHVPDLAAAILGQYLLHQRHGVDRIRQMIIEDIRAALRDGDTAHAARLVSALRQLLTTHQEGHCLVDPAAGAAGPISDALG